MKRRNPYFGCRKIAEQIFTAFGIALNKDVVRRILARHYPPGPDGGGLPPGSRQLRAKNVGSANLGMDGTWVIHPQQAEIANSCFTLTAEQVEDARRVVKLYHEKGGGSIADPKTGEMIDEATIKIALMDLAKGAQAGTVSETELKDWSEKSKAITGYDIPELMRRVA